MTTNPLVPVQPVEEVEDSTAALRARPRPSNEEFASWILIGALILYVLYLHLVSAVVGGLALYLILDRLTTSFSKRMPSAAARPLALVLVSVVTIGGMIGGAMLATSFLRHHADNIPAMMDKMADILQSTRTWLGGFGQQIIPDVLTDAENLKAGAVIWLKRHAAALQVAGGTFSLSFLHMIMGMLLAILVFFRQVTHQEERVRGSLARSLTEKVDRFADAFGRIATAQLKISAVNTLVTALYLVSLPLFGRELPFVTTLIVITFICGFVPILGNLVSNIVIVILSLGVSVGTAIASLIFLVVIHKLQYLLNSRIVGGEIDAQAWEILLAIILGEALFGVRGVVMAPIVYAFVKRELRERGLV